MKRALQLLLVVVLIGGIVAYNIYNKPFSEMEQAKVDFILPAAALFADYETDEATANGKYNDKILLVTGKVLEVSKDEDGITKVVLESEGMFGVVCKLDELTEHERTEFEVGEQVSFKGICTGYLSDVVLVRCIEDK